MNILITGSKGQLGSEFQKISSKYLDFNFTFKNIPELDICDFNKVKKIVTSNNINAIVNCAAYTAVDKSETEMKIAEKININGVNNLVKAIKITRGKLIHISSDYVFDGQNNKPYLETDLTNPINFYGQTKLKGEEIIVNSQIDALVIRTSWLYSSFGNNFVKSMLKMGNERPLLNVVGDQFGTPTYAKDLAEVCLNILNNNHISNNGKIYHYSNDGVTSWYDFARLIMKIGNLNCDVKSIKTKDYPTLAKRPAYSVLSKEKIKKDFNIKIPNWQDSLKECILLINKQTNE
jgi:dTDP-4-dehydrorhamnose reductase